MMHVFHHKTEEEEEEEKRMSVYMLGVGSITPETPEHCIWHMEIHRCTH